MASYIAAYAYGAPHTDTADELLRAYEIRHGVAYPLEGPFLGQALHLGPLWYYVVAMPLWIHESWLAAALFVGFVCSLQFPLAYWCGKQLVDSDFGLLWACALFYPGWTSAQQLAFLNPNAVAAAVLGLLALYLVLSRRPLRAGGFLVMGVAMGVAMHVHPTTAPAYALALLLLSPSRRAIGAVTAVVLLALGFAAPFLPYVWSQAMHGFPDSRSADAYLAHQIAFDNLLNASDVLHHYLVSGPAVVARYWLRWSGAAANAAGWAYWLLVVASLLALRDRAALAPVRRVLPALGVFLTLFVLAIAFLRPTTPVQFTWALAPVVGALIATGLWAIAKMHRGRSAAWTIAAAMVAFNLAAIRAIAIAVGEGEGRVPSSFLDIKRSKTATPVADVWFPAWARVDLGRLSCGDDRTSLHGHLAHIVDRDLGIDALFACAHRDQLWLGGTRPGRHLVGMTRPFWRELGVKPARTLGSLGIATVDSVADAGGIALADGSTYLPRPAGTGPLAEIAFEIDAPSTSAVLLTNMVGRYEAFEPMAAEVDGRVVEAIAGNEISRLYAPARGEARRAKWRFTVRSTHPAAIDVVSFPLANGP